MISEEHYETYRRNESQKQDEKLKKLEAKLADYKLRLRRIRAEIQNGANTIMKSFEIVGELSDMRKKLRKK